MNGSTPEIRLPEAHELEAYKQAHETRRRWEGYIWQYGVIALALIGFLAGRLSGMGVNGQSIKLDFTGKCVLTLLSLFLGSTFLNVFRGRILMKQLEKTIAAFHAQWGQTLPIIPLELDKELTPNYLTLSSTRLAVWSHLFLFVTSLILTGIVWLS